MKKIATLFMMVIALLTVASCAYTKHDIYVTVYPVKYLSEELLDKTPITVGMVPGVSSHEHSAEWSPKQIISMQEADFLIYVGANYDQYITKKLSVFDKKDVQLIKIEDQHSYINFIEGEVHDHNHDHEEHDHTETKSETALGFDPHFWISPKRMLDVLELLYDTYRVAYPNYAEQIDDNYLVVKNHLEELHIEYLEVISQMNKPVLTSTNLYGYLREDYGLSYLSIWSGYHEEPDNIHLADTNFILEEISYHQINTIIFEKNRSSPASNHIFEEMKKTTTNPIKLEYNILQLLSERDRNNQKNYLTVMRDNLLIFQQAGQ